MGEDEGGGDEIIGISTSYFSPSALSPPTRGGEEEFPDGYKLIDDLRCAEKCEITGEQG